MEANKALRRAADVVRDTIRPGWPEATEQELIAFCREHLAHFKCPAAVDFGELPKTSTGKVQKYLLREREWAGRESRIH